MKILKEAKEQLPISFLTDFISKGWEEVGYLKADIEAIRETYKGTKPIEELIQNLVDAYLICIGQLETHISDKKYIEYPEASGLGLNEDLEIKVLSDEAIEVSSDKGIVSYSLNDEEEPTKVTILADKEEEDSEDGKEEIEEEPKKPSKVIEPFEYFVDFDEPDFSEPRLTDKDLYDEE